jgi:hypothetical protein
MGLEVSEPNRSPSRPEPVITSSTMNRMSYLASTSCTRSKWVSGGTITPPAPITGSAMKAAMVSGPSL